MLDAYRTAAAEREAQGIPPLPLDAEQATALCQLLENPPAGEEAFLTHLLEERIAPGVDPASKVKAEWLGAVAHGETSSPLVTPVEAIRLLGTMLGGYNVPFLSRELAGDKAAEAATALANTILVFDNFDVVAKLADEGNAHAKDVLQRWADAEWFTGRDGIEESIDLSKTCTPPVESCT